MILSSYQTSLVEDSKKHWEKLNQLVSNLTSTLLTFKHPDEHSFVFPLCPESVSVSMHIRTWNFIHPTVFWLKIHLFG